ncbi:MAG: hypothetical protein JWQ69_4565 [Pseudomonas sp.]|nr:hypothetical protein [Pseudomonas sp.]
MNIAINPSAVAHQEGWEALRAKVRPLLRTALQAWNLDPDTVYLNGVNDPSDRLVISANSLTDEAVQRILEKDEPSYAFATAGLFSVAYSFADEHRVKGPDVHSLSRIVTELVRTLG